jgi:phenylacetate-CoA ligase
VYAIFKDDLIKKAREVYHQHRAFEQNELTPNQVRKHQELQFKEVFEYVINNSPFYKKHFSEFTTTSIDNINIDNLSALPFTTKDDLRSNGPLLASASLHKSWVYYETTGTTGTPTPCPRNEIDSIHNNTPLITRV